MSNILHTIWRYSGALGVLVVWIGLSLAMRRAGLGLIGDDPISYLGSIPLTARTFSGILLVSSMLFTGFAFYTWRTFSAGPLFLAFFIIGQVGQAIAALAEIGEQSSLAVVHTSAAYALGFSFPLLVWQFTRTQTKSRHYHLFLKLLVFELVTFTVGMGAFIFTKGYAPISEILVAIGFHIWILVLAFLDPKPIASTDQARIT
jgi:hypothetical protein